MVYISAHLSTYACVCIHAHPGASCQEPVKKGAESSSTSTPIPHADPRVGFFSVELLGERPAGSQLAASGCGTSQVWNRMQMLWEVAVQNRFLVAGIWRGT